MREDYLKAQLRKHGIEVIVPDRDEARHSAATAQDTRKSTVTAQSMQP